MSRPRFNRRRLFAGAASLAALAPAAAYAESDAAMARGAVPGADFGNVHGTANSEAAALAATRAPVP